MNEFSEIFAQGEPSAVQHIQVRERIEGGQDQWRKYLVDITNPESGINNTYVIKNVESLDVANDQAAKRSLLKERLIPVPEEFMTVTWNDPTSGDESRPKPAVVSSDLSEDGAYWVVSANNWKDLRSPDFQISISQMNEKNDLSLRKQLAYIAEASAGTNILPNRRGEKVSMVRLGRTALMFRMNRQDGNSRDFQVYAADFGMTDIDILPDTIDRNQCLEVNFDSISYLYTHLTGKIYSLPDDTRFNQAFRDRIEASFKQIKDDYDEIVKRRRW